MDEKRRKIRNKYTQLLLKSKKISEGYESSWSTHCRMFGDLLEPAFADDAASRLELVGALNHDKQREIHCRGQKARQAFGTPMPPATRILRR